MPGENIYSWDILAANNDDSDSAIGWAEGMARAAVNDSARSLMAAHARNRNFLTGVLITSGTANAQTFNSGYAPPFTTVPNNFRVLLKIGPGLTNTGVTTLNMDNISAIEIKDRNGAALAGGELQGDGIGEFVYNGTNWILIHQTATPAPIALPTRQVFLSGSGTYTTPANVKYIEVECLGGGGGGGGFGHAFDGTASTFDTVSAGGGLQGGGGGGSAIGQPGGGGSGSGGDINISGGWGGGASRKETVDGVAAGGIGGSSYFGGAGGSRYASAIGGVSNTGGGGAGGYVSTGAPVMHWGGGGGGSGAYCRKIINSPAATYAYSVGVGGGLGGTSEGVFTGADGGSGIVIVTEHYDP